MSPAEREAWLTRQERIAAESPGHFDRCVAWMAALAYGLVFLVFLFWLGVGVGACIVPFFIGHPLAFVSWAFLAWIGFRSAFRLAGALRVKIDPPEGWQIGEEDAPALAAELRRLCRELRIDPPPRLVVIPDVNASAATLPGDGLLGRPLRQVAVGLPLLQGLSPDEFRAILAHELAHHSRDHPAWLLRLCRVRLAWRQVVVRAASRGEGLFPLETFLSWWWPRFEILTLILSRRHELEADAVAARVAGTEAMGAALVRAELVERYLNVVFWPGLDGEAATTPDPPRDVFTRLGRELKALSAEDQADWLRETLARQAASTDSHPPLRERLERLGYMAEAGAEGVRTEVSPPLARTAAEAWLGDFQGRLEARFSHAWAETMDGAWRKRHREAVLSGETAR